jgi:hypothetical protein
MICGSCGTQNIPGAKYCDNCGLTLPLAGSVPETGVVGQVVPPRTSLKAVFSLISGLLFFIPFSGIGAIVLGHWSRGEIKRSAGRLTGAGVALAGLILGYASVLLVVGIVSAVIIANPGNLRGNFMQGINAGRVGASMSYIATAEKNYAKKFPDVGYTCSLAELGKDHTALIDDELAAGKKYGYAFELLNCEDHKHFNVVATPIPSRGTIQMPTICMDETGAMFDSTKGLPAACRKTETETEPGSETTE